MWCGAIARSRRWCAMRPVNGAPAGSTRARRRFRFAAGRPALKPAKTAQINFIVVAVDRRQRGLHGQSRRHGKNHAGNAEQRRAREQRKNDQHRMHIGRRCRAPVARRSDRSIAAAARHRTQRPKMLDSPVAVCSDTKPAMIAAAVEPMIGMVSRDPVSNASRKAWSMPRMAPSPI